MSPSKKNLPYKKYQCRYFDDRGRPLTPSCREGNACRFVHPNDPNWPGVKCHRNKHSRDVSPHSSWMKHDDRRDRSASPLGRGAPLVSQHTLFRRVKQETEDETPLNYSETEGNRRKGMTPQTTRFQTVSLEGDARGRNIERSVAVEQDPLQSNKANTSNATRDLPNAILSEAEAAKKRSEQFVSMFKDVAMVSSQIVQDTVLYDQEERKLQTFNEITASLAKIPSATAAVAGPIADLILTHAQSKERLDENFRLLGAAWEKVFNSLLADFSLSLENRLQTALSSVKNEAENAMGQLKRRRVSMSPEQEARSKADSHHEAKENEHSSSGYAHSSARDSKRRKVAGQSRSASPDPRQKDETHRPSVVKISLDDILNQMKMKIDQQSSCLQSLSKENEELKNQLQRSSPPRAPRSQRLESSVTESARAGNSTSGQKGSSHSHESRHSSGHRHQSSRTDTKR
ncbi:hypothetical protein BT96DRAFT_975141 [Gymnopus androsaceus JB14]|uniref:C3H1-type domain-containing protein n=1 Tax=Gymnopus androsaceus JB14 TaxID=1447944 RepID=A0A6A4HS50_9AGAR|nr:hypothetical protein BT96DRAFT_975141 [Gymnopus androsaceus JB14]